MRAQAVGTFIIDDGLRELVESPVSVSVGTVAGDRPELISGSGPRVGTDRTSISVFLDRARSGPTVENLQENGQIAVTIAAPVSYRSVQFKGRLRGIHEVDERDRAWVQARREMFVTAIALVGDPVQGARNLWMDDLIRIEFEVDDAFDQTPGPNAGRRL